MRIAIAPLVVTMLVFFASSATAQYPCPADRISAHSHADTIFVLHQNAERNCCSQLTVRMVTQGFVVDFFEGEIDPFCHCMCCFDLRYDAQGFPAGHWLVRVWDDTGSVEYGEAEVDVVGAASAAALGRMVRGDCILVATQPVSWSNVRTLYR